MRFVMTLLMAAVCLCAGEANAEITHPLTRENVDAWLDGLIPRALQAGDIAGGVVVIVKDGEILTERGFGYADVAAKVAVDPRTTVFRPGSISKTFTWTAVMQLVEQGKLDLDADINRYLDFSIPAYDGQPMTMRNVMTHTSGFEEKIKDIVGSKSAPSLESYVKDWIPRRIFPPGVVPAYSNYASTLAGYVVERVSGEPFDNYIDSHVLGPLGMTQSTFRQPAPARLQPLLSKGYVRASEPAQYFEYMGPAPAGSLSATGHDMAKFMIAHLQNGAYGNERILAQETAIQMHAIQPKVYPALHGMALGFYEHSRNGHRVIAHNGGTQFFHSDMHLFLDDGVGVFISLNSPGVDGAASGLHEALFHGFADRYFPAAVEQDSDDTEQAEALNRRTARTGQAFNRPPNAGPTSVGVDEATAIEHASPEALNRRTARTGHPFNRPPNAGLTSDGVDQATAIEHARLVAGTWEDSRRANSSILRILGLLGPLTISANDDGTISFPVPRLGVQRWREVEPFVFRNVDGPDKIQVLLKDGRPVMLGLDMAPPVAFQPTPAWRSPSWVTPALLIAIVSLLISGMSWPIGALLRRKYGVGAPYSGRAAKIYHTSRALSLAAGLLMFATLATLIYMTGGYDRLSSGMDMPLLLLKTAAMIAFVAAAPAAIYDLIVCWPLRRTWFGKLWSINVAISCVVLLAVAIVFNVANLSSNY
jgi:CubicO group peptidase (beta-lactamase class C family)